MAAKGPPWIVHIDEMGKYGHSWIKFFINRIGSFDGIRMAHKTSCFVKKFETSRI